MLPGWPFVGAAAAVIVTPGPDFALVVRQVARGGRRAGYATVAGALTGGCASAAVSVLGGATLFAARPGLFTALQWCGALLLGYLGLRSLAGAAQALRTRRRQPAANPPTGVADPAIPPGAPPPAQPTANLAAQPTANLAAQPTANPAVNPAAQPTADPVGHPSASTTAGPAAHPSPQPGAVPPALPMAVPPARPAAVPPAAAMPERRWRLPYAQGVASNLLNPKVGMFLLAFLPQFVPADRPVTAAMASLAAAFLAFAACWLCVVVEATCRLHRRTATRTGFGTGIEVATGAVLIMIAAHLVTR